MVSKGPVPGHRFFPTIAVSFYSRPEGLNKHGASIWPRGVGVAVGVAVVVSVAALVLAGMAFVLQPNDSSEEVDELRTEVAALQGDLSRLQREVDGLDDNPMELENEGLRLEQLLYRNCPPDGLTNAARKMQPSQSRALDRKAFGFPWPTEKARQNHRSDAIINVDDLR